MGVVMNRLFYLFILSASCFWISSSTYAAVYEAHQVKAVYIFRIASFIRWPDENDMDVITFCGVGNGRVTNTLKKVIQGKATRGKPLRYEPLNEKNIKWCDVVFMPEDETQIDMSVLPPSTLTVSDRMGFGDNKGMIELRTFKGKIKPVINLANIKSSELNITSQLLRVATLVRGGE